MKGLREKQASSSSNTSKQECKKILPFASPAAFHEALQKALQAQGIIVSCQFSILPYTTSSSPSSTASTTAPIDWIDDSENTIADLFDLAWTVFKPEKKTPQALNNFKQSCQPLIRKIFKLAKEHTEDTSILNDELVKKSLTVVLEQDPNATENLCDLLCCIQMSFAKTNTPGLDRSMKGKLLLCAYVIPLNAFLNDSISQEKSISIPQEEQDIILERFDSLKRIPKILSPVGRTELQKFLGNSLALDYKEEISEIAKEESPLLVTKRVTALIRRATEEASKKEQEQKEKEPIATQISKKAVPEPQPAALVSKRRLKKERQKAKRNEETEVLEEHSPTNPTTPASSSDPQTKEPVVSSSTAPSITATTANAPTSAPAAVAESNPIQNEPSASKNKKKKKKQEQPHQEGIPSEASSKISTTPEPRSEPQKTTKSVPVSCQPSSSRSNTSPKISKEPIVSSSTAPSTTTPIASSTDTTSATTSTQKNVYRDGPVTAFGTRGLFAITFPAIPELIDAIKALHTQETAIPKHKRKLGTALVVALEKAVEEKGNASGKSARLQEALKLLDSHPEIEVNQVTRSGAIPLETLLESTEEIALKTLLPYIGKTPLYMAIELGDVSLVEKLLNKGAKIIKVDFEICNENSGLVRLYVCNTYELLRTLSYVSPRLIALMEKHCKKTLPIHEAIVSRDDITLKIVTEEMLTSGVKVNRKDDLRYSAKDWAYLMDFQDKYQYLASSRFYQKNRTYVVPENTTTVATTTQLKPEPSPSAPITAEQSTQSPSRSSSSPSSAATTSTSSLPTSTTTKPTETTEPSMPSSSGSSSSSSEPTADWQECKKNVEELKEKLAIVIAEEEQHNDDDYTPVEYCCFELIRNIINFARKIEIPEMLNSEETEYFLDEAMPSGYEVIQTVVNGLAKNFTRQNLSYLIKNFREGYTEFKFRQEQQSKTREACYYVEYLASFTNSKNYNDEIHKTVVCIFPKYVTTKYLAKLIHSLGKLAKHKNITLQCDDILKSLYPAFDKLIDGSATSQGIAMIINGLGNLAQTKLIILNCDNIIASLIKALLELLQNPDDFSAKAQTFAMILRGLADLVETGKINPKSSPELVLIWENAIQILLEHFAKCSDFTMKAQSCAMVFSSLGLFAEKELLDLNRLDQLKWHENLQAVAETYKRICTSKDETATPETHQKAVRGLNLLFTCRASNFGSKEITPLQAQSMFRAPTSQVKVPAASISPQPAPGKVSQ